MKQLIKYFLSFFSQHVELEQTICELNQELCDLHEHAERLKYECELSQNLALEQAKKLDYALIDHQQKFNNLKNNYLQSILKVVFAQL